MGAIMKKEKKKKKEKYKESIEAETQWQKSGYRSAIEPIISIVGSRVEDSARRLQPSS